MSVFHTQLCGLIFNHGPQKYFGKWLYLVGEFQNLSARFFDRLNPKIFIDNHVLYEAVRDNFVYNFCSIELTFQLLAHVGHKKATSKRAIFPRQAHLKKWCPCRIVGRF